MNASALTNGRASSANWLTDAMPCTESSQWITCSRCGCALARALSGSRNITDASSRLA
ncbi:hypothetical protein D3C78_1843160 [compost metagenome]